MRATIPQHPLGRRVRRTIRRHGLLVDGDRVAVALSGGSDSIALTWLLAEIAARAAWDLVGLIHVNHRLRGDESDADEAFCRALAERLRLPFDARRVDVRQRARDRHQSLEAAARDARYAAFDAAARELGANLVATGHTQDDQAETVLLRLFRGTGARGVSAIRPRRHVYVRPLLDCRRADLRAYLESRGETFRDDSSNLDLTIPRNRVRHTLLPVMVREWPSSIAALARFAELASDDEAFLTRTASEVAAALTLPASGGVQRLDTRGLNQLPAALARRIVRRALERAGAPSSFRDIEAVRALARADNGEGHLDLHGGDVDRDGPALMFGGPRPIGSGTDAFEYVLQVPGAVAVSETGTTIRASLIKGSAARPLLDVSAAVLQAERVCGPLVVRSRRPGDRVRPLGAPGSRKLQDVLVDRKVPRRERDAVPVVVDASGRIVWVAGLVIAHEYRVTRPESGMVVLEITKGNQ